MRVTKWRLPPPPPFKKKQQQQQKEKGKEKKYEFYSYINAEVRLVTIEKTNTDDPRCKWQSQGMDILWSSYNEYHLFITYFTNQSLLGLALVNNMIIRPHCSHSMLMENLSFVSLLYFSKQTVDKPFLTFYLRQMTGTSFAATSLN